MDTSTVNTAWQHADLDRNRKAHEMAHAEFIATNGRAPQTLAELQSVWRRQSVILSSLTK